jgi:hypothetical protein
MTPVPKVKMGLALKELGLGIAMYIVLKLMYFFSFQNELFCAPTQKKEANINLHMPSFLEREVGCELTIHVPVQMP